MSVATAADRDRIAARWTDEAMAVVALCAAWCAACAEFRGAFERIAGARPDVLFVWLDIEDDAELCGEIDLENFPTLAIFRGAALLHYGVSLPQEGTAARLVDAIAERSETMDEAPEAVLELPRALR